MQRRVAGYGGAGNHRDPGYYWQWCQYMQGLGGGCSCADTWPLWNCTTDRTEAVRCKDGQVEIEACADGCEVMPVGTEDVCHGANGSGSGSASGDPGAPDGGTRDPGAGGDDDGGATAGGCAAAGGDAHAIGLALIALVWVARRRARRAA